MSIELNRVGVEIDGKVYQFYKMSFGFQRKLVELQSQLGELTNALAKKYEILSDEVTSSEKVTQDEKLQLAKKSLEMQDALAMLFVNQEESKILDNFDGDNVAELIKALQ